MITLEEYKNVLVNHYHYEMDNSEIMRDRRREYLNKHYSDAYLSKIINDTYNVIKTILDISEEGYLLIDMDDDTTSYISLNLIGGWFSDTLYTDSSGNIISKYILKQTFGNGLEVWVKEEEYYFDTKDPDIVSFDYRYSLCLQNFPKNMEGFKEELFGISRTLKIK